uniref:alpha-amylase n=1 Tax=Sinocyclocheilus anshuiensis TaxID=1608454 RepID=A0A671RWF9_9TELE
MKLLILVALFGLGFAQHNPNMKNGRTSIVHLFEWHWADIISPASEHVKLSNPWHPWWQRYQPIGYNLCSRSGTEAELKDMITRCNNVGVNIYVDIVINHMCKSIHGEGTPSSCGSKFNGNKEDFPSVPYSYLDFNDGKCKTGSGHIENYHDIYQVRDCRLEDLLDLALEKDYVRGKLHTWPGDLTNVYGRLKTLNTKWFPSGTKPFIYQEVFPSLFYPINLEFTLHKIATGLMLAHPYGVTRVMSSYRCDRKIVNGKVIVLIMFVDNHDNQRGHGAGGASVLTFWDSRLHKIATGLMLAHPYGVTRVMSSYRWDRKIVNGKDENDWMGPPSFSDGSTKPVPINPDSTCGDNWVCEHRWRQIRNMVIFRNVVNGQPLSNWWDNGNNQIAFSRGSKGFIVINNDDWALNVTLNTGLPMGTYCDVISGDKIGGTCTGKQVSVGSDGRATFSISNTDEDPFIAIHANSKLWIQ